MKNFVTALESAITTDSMFGTLTSLVPFVGSIVLFAFAYYVIRKVIKKASDKCLKLFICLNDGGFYRYDQA